MAAIATVTAVSRALVLRVLRVIKTSPRTIVMSVQAAREKFHALADTIYEANINVATGYVAFCLWA